MLRFVQVSSLGVKRNESDKMKPSTLAIRLATLIALLALVAAGVGLFYGDGGSEFSFVTARGDTVQLYGQGLYRYDTPLTAVGFKAADAVMLAFSIPVLVLSAIFYRKGSVRSGFLLAGVLTFFVYNYASMAFGAVYNNLYLIYVALLGSSAIGLIATLWSFDVQSLPARFSDGLPHRGIGIFLIVCGIILSLVWLGLSIVPALLAGQTPLEARYYSTFTTGVIDIALVAPALITAGIFILRRVPFGYLVAPTMLVFTVIISLNLASSGIAQLSTGVMTTGQALGFTIPFVIMGLFAIWLLGAVMRQFDQSAPANKRTMQTTHA